MPLEMTAEIVRGATIASPMLPNSAPAQRQTPAALSAVGDEQQPLLHLYDHRKEQAREAAADYLRNTPRMPFPAVVSLPEFGHDERIGALEERLYALEKAMSVGSLNRLG